MCNATAANDEADTMGAAPAAPVRIPCHAPDTREVQDRAELPPAQRASDKLEVHAEYEIVVIASRSEGTGECTASLNILPYLPDHTYVLYGADRADSLDIKEHGRAQIRELTGAPDPDGGAPLPWEWTHRDKRHRPRHWDIVPGNRPLLVLAPHGYWDRELNFTAALPPGSVLVCWSPFGYPGPDYGRHGVWLAVPGGNRRLGYHCMGTLTRVETHTDSLYSVVPAPPVFTPDLAVTPAELFAMEAYNLSREGRNRLCCVYGHGTNAEADRVLANLLVAAAAGTREGRWVIILVIHHYTDDDVGRELSRPRHIAQAINRTNYRDFVHTSRIEADNPPFRIANSEERRIRIYHMQKLPKRCIDWMFNVADLPIVEGANSVAQVLAAGRPFLRACRTEGTYLGEGTAAIDAAERAVYGAGLDALSAASMYVSTGVNPGVGAAALRALLFNYPERAALDALAVHLAESYFTPQNSPLSFIAPYLLELNRALLAEPLVNMTFTPVPP